MAGRRGLLLVLAVAAAVAVALAWPAIERVRRGYGSTHGARIVPFDVRNRLLRGLPGQILVLPRGWGRGGPLLVLLHGRSSSPSSFLSDAFLGGLAALGRRAPAVALLDGGDHSYYHDRADGAWGSYVLREAL